jgi:hypothetical protein
MMREIGSGCPMEAPVIGAVVVAVAPVYQEKVSYASITGAFILQN